MPTLVLSVVVAGSRAGGPLPGLFACLEERLLAGEAELLIVTAAERPVAATSLPNVTIIAMAPGTTIPLLREEGLRCARAPWVVLTEDFCVPCSTWLAELEAARDPAQGTVVGGPISRREGTSTDWARTFSEYGRFLQGGTGGPVDDVPGCNVAYERNHLAHVLDNQPSGFKEVLVHERLRSSGSHFWLAPAAVVFDESHATLWSTSRAMYHHGRLFGGERMAGAPWPVRILRAASSPLVPAIHLLRIARGAYRVGRLGRLVRCLLPLLAIEVSWAWGECLGSLRGVGSSGSAWH